MAVDGKYGRVTLERGTIGAVEPVVVFRAQDHLLPALLDVYAELCREAGSPARHVDGVAAARARVVEWQAANFTQVPRSDGAA